jgi:hypothetical protein
MTEQAKRYFERLAITKEKDEIIDEFFTKSKKEQREILEEFGDKAEILMTILLKLKGKTK